MKRFLAAIAVMLVAGLGVTSVAEAAPNVVKMTTIDGKKRIKVKSKKLPFYVSCSKNCAGKLTLTLVTPVTKDSVSGNVTIEAGKIITPRFPLTKFGLRYVKKNISKCKLKVTFSVVDLDTGKRDVKRKTFRFYK